MSGQQAGVAWRCYMKAFPGCSDNSARVSASRLLTKANISRRINELFQERTTRLKVTGDWLIQLLAEQAAFDYADALDENGQLLNIRMMAPHVRRNIAGVDHTRRFVGVGEDAYEEIITKIKTTDRSW